ncbi:hypothetical protein GQ600_26063 [Phytophthora cactorum]|nr:hypothetical protein GQ600_26063 [Phytophthora cactorum]
MTRCLFLRFQGSYVSRNVVEEAASVGCMEILEYFLDNDIIMQSDEKHNDEQNSLARSVAWGGRDATNAIRAGHHGVAVWLCKYVNVEYRDDYEAMTAAAAGGDVELTGYLEEKLDMAYDVRSPPLRLHSTRTPPLLTSRQHLTPRPSPHCRQRLTYSHRPVLPSVLGVIIIRQRCLSGASFDDASCAVSCGLSVAAHRFSRLPTGQSSASNDTNIPTLDPMGVTGRSRILLPCDFKCRVAGHSRGGTGTVPETVATVLTRDIPRLNIDALVEPLLHRRKLASWHATHDARLNQNHALNIHHRTVFDFYTNLHRVTVPFQLENFTTPLKLYVTRPRRRQHSHQSTDQFVATQFAARTKYFTIRLTKRLATTSSNGASTPAITVSSRLTVNRSAKLDGGRSH